MNKQQVDKAFVSEYDLFLHKFDKEHDKLSDSQLKEIEKFRKIYALRDGKAREKASIFKRLFRIFYSSKE